MAGSTGKLEVEIEVKSNANKFWGTIRDSTVIFPKALSHDYKSIEVVEGDGKAPGSVRKILYGEGTHFLHPKLQTYETFGTFLCAMINL